MADESEEKNGVKLPPKLNLRKELSKSESEDSEPAEKGPGPEVSPNAPPSSGADTIPAQPAELAPGSPLGTKPGKPQAPTTEQPAEPAKAGQPKKETSRIPLETAKPAGPGAPGSPGTITKRPVLKKGETSRIPLSAVGADEGERAGAPKTIKIKPTLPPGAVRFGKPGQEGEGTAEAPEDEKSKTSRIPLEKALSPDEGEAETGAEEAPQTVKLKPSSEAPTIKAKPAAKDALGKTARLDIPPEEEAEAEEAGEEGPTPTRRKTIRVKRPQQRPGMPSAEVARAEGAPAAQPVPGAAPKAPGKLSWIFPVVAAAAIVVACVVVYLLAVQALPDMNLSWPGKIGSV